MNFSLDLLDAITRRDVVYYVIGSLEAEEVVNEFLWCSLIISVIAFVIGIIMKYSKKDCLINSIMTYMTSFVVLSLYNISKLSVFKKYITGGSTIKIEDVLWNKSALLIGVIIAVSIIVCALLFDKKKKLRMLLPIETLLISSIVIKSITYEWPTDKIVNDKVLLIRIINIITIAVIIIIFKLLSKLDKNSNSKKMVLLDYVLIIIFIAISISLLLFYKTLLNNRRIILVIKSLIYSLFLTIVIELTTSIFQGVRTKKDIAIIILTNSITNPIVVYIVDVMMLYGSIWMYWILVIIMEISVVFIEGAIYSKTLDYDKKSGYKLSLINNFTSFTIGLLVQLLSSIII